MYRAAPPHLLVMFSLVASAACGHGAASNVTASRPKLSAKQEILAQELGEMPAPPGQCPERVEANVLGNPRAAVHRTALGLAYCILKEGPPGVVSKPSDSVRVHYSGWTEDGKMFDSTIERGQPLEFALHAVIRGWTEGLQLMTPGDKARLWVPAHLGYGQQERTAEGQAAPKGTLIFDIELIDVQRAPPPEPEPAHAEAEPQRQLAPRGLPVEKEKKRSSRDIGEQGHQH